MNEQSAIQYLALRAKRLLWPDYNWEFVTIVVKANEVKTIEAQDYLYLIISVDDDVAVESDNGYYGKKNKAVSNLIEEHTGSITITNQAKVARYVRFLQAIPLNVP